MRLLSRLDLFPHPAQPVVLTLGNFDGVHLGHCRLLRRVVALARQQETLSVVLTFSNHPSSILSPETLLKRVITSSHKLQLLEALSVDLVIDMPFTSDLACSSYEEFLTTLRQMLPFSCLVLGHDAVLGYRRQGTCDVLPQLARRLDFQIEYLPPVAVKGQLVSSSAIRLLIAEGRLNEASELLGRPYSIQGPVVRGRRRGTWLGFPTVNLEVAGLCLPPYGAYAARVIAQGKTFQAMAGLGTAPSVSPSRVTPLLEAHLFDFSGDLTREAVEVQLVAFLRPQSAFLSLEALQAQLTQDALHARKALNTGHEYSPSVSLPLI